MPQQTQTAQEETFEQRAKIALIRRRKSIDWLALHIGRPQTSVSTAINHPTAFPELKKEIARFLRIAL